MTWSLYTQPKSATKDEFTVDDEHHILNSQAEGFRNMFHSILAEEPRERPVCLPTENSGITLFKRAFTLTTISPQDAISIFHDIRKLILSIPWDTEQCEVTFTTALQIRLHSLSCCRVKDRNHAIDVLSCILTHSYIDESKSWWRNQTHTWANYLLNCLDFEDDGFPVAALRRQLKQTLSSLNIKTQAITSTSAPMVHPDTFIMAITAAVSRGILATGLNFQAPQTPATPHVIIPAACTAPDSREEDNAPTAAAPVTTTPAAPSPSSAESSEDLDDLLPDCDSECDESQSSEEQSSKLMKICKYFKGKGSCRYGDHCRNVHAIEVSDSSESYSSVEDLEAFMVQPHNDCDLSSCPKCKSWFHSVIKMPGVCLRCLQQGHPVSRCTGEISHAASRCKVCGFPKHGSKPCVTNSGICSRCRERGHKPSACPRELPLGKSSIESLFSRASRRRL